jgi:hypothetical protein
MAIMKTYQKVNFLKILFYAVGARMFTLPHHLIPSLDNVHIGQFEKEM